MLLTLHTNSVRSLLRPSRGQPTLDLVDLPRKAREEFGLYGLNLTTDLLAGAFRARLEKLREAADKSGCACLVLIEQDPLALADANDDKALAALERIERVIRGAQLLGCNSIAFKIAGKADDDTLERAVEHLKEAAEKADRGEINLLISPMDGLTGEPERVTSIIKKVGGFRVGTFPDFEVASKAADPVTYLRRLTPYASAVCAATIEFIETADTAPPALPPEPVKKTKSKSPRLSRVVPTLVEGVPVEVTPADREAEEAKAQAEAEAQAEAKRSKPKSKAKVDPLAALADALELPASKGRRSKAKASAAPPPERKSEEDEDAREEEELKKLGEELGMMGEEGWSELEAMLENVPPPPEHRPYSIDKLVAAVVSVGYDGTLAIDYRGKGDITSGILNSRSALDAAMRAAMA